MSNLCKHCGVRVKSDLINCPLCGRYVDGNDGKLLPTTYPDSARLKVRPVKSRGLDIAVRALPVLAVIAVIINIFVNIYQDYGFSHEHIWSVYAVMGVFDVIMCILRPIKNRRYKWPEVFWLVVCVNASVILVDWVSDVWVDWSIAYVLPNLLAAFSLVVGAVIFLRKNGDPANALLTELITLLTGIGYLIMNTLLWSLRVVEMNILPTFISFAVILATFLVLLIFRFRTYIANLVKKFHV